MQQIFNIMVLGGYGNFGQLISTALYKSPNISVTIAGRDVQKAKKLAESLQCNYQMVDVNKDNLSEIFKNSNIHLVISTVGPFQGQSYHIAESAIKAGIHYIDLADAREFVEEITKFNDIAQEKNLFICSGASTVPGLTSAAINHYLPQFSTLDIINICLSSSEKVPGISTLSAVLSYAGLPYSVWKNREWTTVYGLHDIEHHTFYNSPKKRWVANCNVPDLALFPDNYPNVREVTFKAGIGIGLVQFSSSFVAWLRRLKLFPNPLKFVNLFYKIAQQFERFGNGLSVMQVKMIGNNEQNQPLEINWEIVGYENEGPNIPCFAAIILARKLANQDITKYGAFSSMNLITLDEYLKELKGLNIQTFTHTTDQSILVKQDVYT